MTERGALWAGVLACVACSGASSVRSDAETTLVVIPPAPPSETRRAAERRALTSTTGMDDFWRRLTSTLAASGEPLGSFTHPDIGVFAVWPYERTRVVARFDALEELRGGDIAPELSALRAVPLPSRVVHVPAVCSSDVGADAVAFPASGTILDDVYSSMRSSGLLPDDSTEDQRLAQKADHAISYSVRVRARRLSFLLGQHDARWYLLALEVGAECPNESSNG